MNSEEKFLNFEAMESEIFRELYKKTPLKKRPIKENSFSPEEKKTSPKPRACSLPEGRLSKRKMYKPIKKLIDSYDKSSAVIEPSPKAMYVPVIKSPAESRVTPVKVNNKAVNFAMTMAIPELKKASVGTKVPSKNPKWSKEMKNLTQQEWEDFNLALELQNEDFNLRERRPRMIPSNLSIQSKRKSLPVNTKHTSSDSMESSYISSPKKPRKKASKGKQNFRRTSKQSATFSGESVEDAFSGRHLRRKYNLSDDLYKIVSNKERTGRGVIRAMKYVFLERNVYGPDRKSVTCDDELSKKLFAGKRRIRLNEMKPYLNKHVSLLP